MEWKLRFEALGVFDVLTVCIKSSTCWILTWLINIKYFSFCYVSLRDFAIPQGKYCVYSWITNKF